ncbi:AMP-binding protein [Pyxidicoccus sp. 3LG]
MNFLRTLNARADSTPESRAYTFLSDGESDEQHLSYAQVLQRSREVGGLLQDAGARGEPVLLLFPPGLDYLIAFLGCMQAGAIAVPAYPPDPARLARTLPRLEALTADARARFVLAPGFIRDMAGGLFEQAGALASARWLALDGRGARARERLEGPGGHPGHGGLPPVHVGVHRLAARRGAHPRQPAPQLPRHPALLRA